MGKRLPSGHKARKAKAGDHDLGLPTAAQAQDAAKALRTIAERLDTYAWTLQQNQPDVEAWLQDTREGGVFLAMVRRALRSADAVRKVEAGADRDRVYERCVRAIELLDIAKGVTPEPRPQWLEELLTRCHHGLDETALLDNAVQYVRGRIKADTEGLALISDDAWRDAIEKWRGFVRGTAGNPKNRARPYSAHRILFDLFKPVGLTDAKNPKGLSKLLRDQGLYTKA